jgi:hypothetical protein
MRLSAPRFGNVGGKDSNKRTRSIYYRTGRGDHDRRWRHVNRGGAGADEAADHTADEPAEGGVAGVVAMGEGPHGECREGQRYA